MPQLKRSLDTSTKDPTCCNQDWTKNKINQLIKKITETHSLSVLGARSLNQGVGRGALPWKAGGDPLWPFPELCGGRHSGASLGLQLQHFHFCLQGPEPLSLCVSVFTQPASYKDTESCWIRGSIHCRKTSC